MTIENDRTPIRVETPRQDFVSAGHGTGAWMNERFYDLLAEQGIAISPIKYDSRSVVFRDTGSELDADLNSISIRFEPQVMTIETQGPNSRKVLKKTAIILGIDLSEEELDSFCTKSDAVEEPPVYCMEVERMDFYGNYYLSDGPPS